MKRLVHFGVAAVLVGLPIVAGLTVMPVVHAAEKTAATSQKSDQKKETKYVGNSESKKYHKPTCRYAKATKKQNRVEFASAAEAKKAGYEACKVCLRTEKNTDGKVSSSGAGAADKSTTKNTKSSGQ